MASAALLQGRSGAAITTTTAGARGRTTTTTPNTTRAPVVVVVCGVGSHPRANAGPAPARRSKSTRVAASELANAASSSSGSGNGNDSDAVLSVAAAAAATAATASPSARPAFATSSFSSRDDEDTDAAEGAAGGGPDGGAAVGGSAGVGGGDPSLAADDLFDRRHLPPLGEWPADLLLYFPVGCALAAARLAVWVACIALDLPSFRSRAAVEAYLALLGVRVVWRHADRIYQPPAAPRAFSSSSSTLGQEEGGSGRHVLVSNHVSVGDLMMLFAVPDAEEAAAAAQQQQQQQQQLGAASGDSAAGSSAGRPISSSLPPRRRYVHLVTSALPGAVTATRHLPALLRPASRATYDRLAGVAGAPATAASALQRRRHRRQQQQGGSASSSGRVGNPNEEEEEDKEELSAPVHVFPEGGMTHGRRAMLSFSRGFTRLLGGSGPHAASVVVPVALRLRTHPAARLVRSHTLASGFLANLFWFSFAPWTELEATALEPVSWRPAETGESRGAFVRRVQAAIAAELGVGVAALTVQQKRQLMTVGEEERGGAAGVAAPPTAAASGGGGEAEAAAAATAGGNGEGRRRQQ